MIKINLCPIDELENPYWYFPDVATIVLALVIGWFGVQYYLGLVQTQIDDSKTEVASLQESTKKLSPDIEHFKNLDKQIKELNSKLTALKTITVSKISKYEPVIVLEHLQNLKPDGVWYTQVHIGGAAADKNGAPADKNVPAVIRNGAAPDKNGVAAARNAGARPEPAGKGAGTDETSFEVHGQAFDNILTAELMTAIRSTGSQEFDQADVRTQVYFPDLSLDGAKLPQQAPAGFPELGKFPEFVIKGHFKERSAADKPHGEDDEETPDEAKAEPPKTVSEAEGDAARALKL